MGLTAVYLTAAVLAAGCSRKSDQVVTSADEQPVTQTVVQLQAGVDNALRIPVVPARDNVLRRLAPTAAHSNQPAMCDAILAKIADPGVRKEAAQACAADRTQQGDKAGAAKYAAMAGK